MRRSAPFLAQLRKQNVRQVEVHYHEHDLSHIKVTGDDSDHAPSRSATQDLLNRLTEKDSDEDEDPARSP